MRMTTIMALYNKQKRLLGCQSRICWFRCPSSPPIKRQFPVLGEVVFKAECRAWQELFQTENGKYSDWSLLGNSTDATQISEFPKIKFTAPNRIVCLYWLFSTPCKDLYDFSAPGKRFPKFPLEIRVLD